MLLNIATILDPDALNDVSSALKTIQWRDGSKTAGSSARPVKKNLQADLNGDGGAALHDRLMDALQSNSVLQAAARPKHFSRLIVSRTKGGGRYGAHIDNALMHSSTGRIRTDLAFSLFLSAPESYDGGELVVQYPGFEQRFKPNAGDLILYPSTQIHEVKPVTKGERFVCVGWIESLVRSPEQRETLFDLTNLSVSISSQYAPESSEILTLHKSISNLVRLWASP